MNYRDLQNRLADYQVKLRDREIELRGVKTWIRRPKNEDTEDFYGDLEMNWWRVLSSQVQHLERRTSKIIRMTPVREPLEEFSRTASISSASSLTVDATRIPA
jgi:hypothetical protein